MLPGTVVKLVDPETLRLEREREAEAKAAKEAAKAEAKRKREEEERKKMEKGRTPPDQLFANDPEYSQLDERGIPTATADGEPLAKAARKKLEKAYGAQEKLHKKVGDGGNGGGEGDLACIATLLRAQYPPHLLQFLAWQEKQGTQ